MAEMLDTVYIYTHGNLIKNVRVAHLGDSRQNVYINDG